MATYDAQIADWTREVVQRHGSLSSRRLERVTGVSYGTIQNMLAGKRVEAGLVIRFAGRLRESIPAALRVFGYAEEADLWEHGAAPPPGAEDGDGDPLTDDAREVIDYYEGMPPDLQPEARRYLRYLFEQQDRREARQGRSRRRRAEQGA